MSTVASSTLRWTRAALLATVTLALGSVAHVGADGRLPGAVPLAGVLVVATLAAAPFLGRRASRLRVVALLLAGQTAVHGALSLLAGHAGDPRGAVAPVPTAASSALPVGSVPRTGSFREQMAQLAPHASGEATAGALPWAHLVEHVAEQPPLMVLAHLVAAAAVGLWLAAGEAALFTVVALLAAPVLAAAGTMVSLATAVLAVVRGTAAARRTAGRLRGGSRTVVLVQHLATGVVARRGPPAPRAV